MALGPQFPHERHFTIPTVTNKPTDFELRVRGEITPEEYVRRLTERTRREREDYMPTTHHKAPAQRVPDGAVVEAKRMDDGAISPKTILAATIPAIGTLIGVVVLGLLTGEFDELELAAAITGVSSSALAGLAAYLGKPGQVVVSRTVR